MGAHNREIIKANTQVGGIMDDIKIEVGQRYRNTFSNSIIRVSSLPTVDDYPYVEYIYENDGREASYNKNLFISDIRNGFLELLEEGGKDMNKKTEPTEGLRYNTGKNRNPRQAV